MSALGDNPVYTFDRQGNTLVRCGACDQWTRLFGAPRIVFGRWGRQVIERWNPVTREVEEQVRSLPFTKQVLACPDCEERLRLKTVAARRAGKPDPFLTAEDAMRPLAAWQQIRESAYLDEEVAVLERAKAACLAEIARIKAAIAAGMPTASQEDQA